MLKGIKSQEKDYRGYVYHNPKKQVPRVNERVRNIQVTPIVGLPTPVISQTSQVYQQNAYFDDEPRQSRSTYGTQ